MSESTVSAPASPNARNQRVLVFGAIAAALAIGLVAYFLMAGKGKGSTSPLASGQGSTPVAQVPASASPSAAASGAMAVPALYKAPAGRDPFSPLVTTPTPTAAPASASASASVSSAPAAPSATSLPTVIPTPTIIIPTATATVTLTPSPAATVTVTPSSTSLPTSSQALTLTLVSVDTNAGTATVKVNDGTNTNTFNPKSGQVFDTYFKLVSLLSSDPNSPPVTYGADFEYGDQFVQLTQGQSAQLN